MLKRSEIRLMLRSLAVISLIIFLSGDVLRGKSWEMGPVQLIGTGLGIGLLIADFSCHSRFTRTGLKLLLSGGVVSILAAVLYFIGYNSTHWFTLLTMGILFGIGSGSMIAGILIIKKITRSLIIEISLFLLMVIPFTISICIKYIDLDFWYDEVYSLYWFILVPVINSITDYNAPNNHILFSLVSNVYLKIIGAQDIYTLLENTYKLRILMLVFSITALTYLYLIGKKYFNRFIAATALIILVTTIPFYNFAVQVRGYGLSIMLVCMLLYYLWGYEAKPNRKDAFLTTILSSLLLYTIPTNFYFIGSIALFYFALVIHQFIHNISSCAKPVSMKTCFTFFVSTLYKNKNAHIIFFIAAGCLLSMLFYIPVLEQLHSNAMIKRPMLFPFPVFYPKMVQTYFFLMSERYLLLAIVISAASSVFISSALNNKKRQALPDQIIQLTQMENKSTRLSTTAQQIEDWFLTCQNQPAAHGLTYWYTFSGFALLFPFVISFFHGYDPYYRVFVFVVPVTVLITALCIFQLCRITPKFHFKTLFTIIFITAYCYPTFFFGLQQRDERILMDIYESKTSQDMFYNYYQAHYNPSRVLKDFSEQYIQEGIPVFIYQWGDTQAIPLYATKFLIRHHKIESPQELFTNEDGQAQIITVHPYQFIQDAEKLFPKLTCIFLNQQPDYLGIIACSCKGTSSADTACPPKVAFDQ